MILSLLVSFTIFPPPPHLTFLVIELEQNISLGFHGDALPARELSEETLRQTADGIYRQGRSRREKNKIWRLCYDLISNYLLII